MNNLPIYAICLCAFLLVSCSQENADTAAADKNPEVASHEQIKVLNFGTFHMAPTPDAKSTEFDEHDRNNKEKVHEVAEKLSEFKPTVILVEIEPRHNEELQKKYARYLDNPGMEFETPSEIELLAFELGRLSNTERIYGIDHKMRYNYRIGQEIDNRIDPEWHDNFYDEPQKFFPELNVNRDTLSVLQNLKVMNRDRFLDFLIALNADMLTHAGTSDGFEGADEAAKYYQRNLRMFSNLNRIDLSPEDRVFILMGASHTAFFRDFFSRNPKYDMVDTFKYLK